MFLGFPKWFRMAPSSRRRSRLTGLGLAVLVAISCLAMEVHGAVPPVTPPVTSFTTRFGHYLADPVRPRMYALDYESGLHVINTDTLTVEKTITVGRVPKGLSMSPDGTTLYVVSTDSLEISVIDLETLERVRTMALVHTPSDIEAGLNGRLYIANPSGELLQVNAETGEVEASLFGAGTSPELEISPDRKTLYSGQTGQSGRVASFDVSGASVSHLLTLIDFSSYDGYGFALSHDGELLAYSHPLASPDYTYGTGVLLAAADLSLVSQLPGVGDTQEPSQIIFSLDDSVLFQGHSSNGGWAIGAHLQPGAAELAAFHPGE